MAPDLNQLVPDSVKTKLDVAAVGTAGITFFADFPFSQLAAALTCVWLVLRIVEMIVAWFKK